MSPTGEPMLVADNVAVNQSFAAGVAYLHDHGRRLSLGYGVTLHVCDLLPKSRGQVRLGSPDPMAHPRISANYLSHPDDLPTLVNGLKLARRILAAPALAAVDAVRAQ